MERTDVLFVGASHAKISTVTGIENATFNPVYLFMMYRNN